MDDRNRIGWGDWDSDDRGDRRRGNDRRRGDDRDDGDDGFEGGVGRPSRRANLILGLVLAAVFLVSIVLCCVAAGEAGQLFRLELPPP